MTNSTFEKIGRIVCAMLLVPLILAFTALLFGFPVKWLWNWLMPTLFGLRGITFLQAVGLMYLAGLLFGQSKSKDSK